MVKDMEVIFGKNKKVGNKMRKRKRDKMEADAFPLKKSIFFEHLLYQNELDAPMPSMACT